MTCPNCTKMIPDDSRFCCHCGTNFQTKSNKQHAQMINSFIARYESIFPKDSLPIIKQQLEHIPDDAMEVFYGDYHKVYKKVSLWRFIGGFILFLPILISLSLLFAELALDISEYVQAIIIFAILALFLPCYLIFPNPKRKALNAFQKTYSSYIQNNPTIIANYNLQRTTMTPNPHWNFRNIKDVNNVVPYSTLHLRENKMFMKYLTKNFPTCEISQKVPANQLFSNAPDYAMPINFMLTKGNKKVVILIVECNAKYKRYSVLETMELCKENNITALRFITTFPNEETYVVQRIRKMLE